MILALVLLAHSWYPAECCGGDDDCYPIPCAEIRSEGDYLVYRGHGFRKDRALTSEDGLCHVCIAGGELNESTGVSICIFIGEVS